MAEVRVAPRIFVTSSDPLPRVLTASKEFWAREEPEPRLQHNTKSRLRSAKGNQCKSEKRTLPTTKADNGQRRDGLTQTSQDASTKSTATGGKLGGDRGWYMRELFRCALIQKIRGIAMRSPPTPMVPFREKS